MTTSQSTSSTSQLTPNINPLLNPALSDEDRVELRRRIVEQMHIQGQSGRAIARQLTAEGYEISYRTIHRDLVIIKERWQTDLDWDIHDIKAQELAKIMEVERRCWLGVTQSMANRLHNAAIGYMNQLLRVVERRAKMLGLDAPVRQPGEDAAHPLFISSVENYDSLSEEEINRELQREISDAIQAGEIDRDTIAALLELQEIIDGSDSASAE